ncbi:MAG TPA: hypothetical protein VG106_00390, partial [Vicinamibacterales bacterium]|nr:hypothetical protein [Vicinamibacterales bacterium]
AFAVLASAFAVFLLSAFAAFVSALASFVVVFVFVFADLVEDVVLLGLLALTVVVFGPFDVVETVFFGPDDCIFGADVVFGDETFIVFGDVTCVFGAEPFFP